MKILVKDIATLKQFIAAEGSSSLAVQKPAIAQVERNYIQKVLGDAVYANLIDGVENNDLTADEELLLNEVMLALAPLSYYTGSPVQQVRFGDRGLHTSQSDSTERLTKWMYDEFRTQLLIDGYNALDNLFLYMEKQTGADWYEDWTESDAYTTYMALFVNSAKIFDDHVKIKASRWLFAYMVPMLGNTETFFIIPAISKELSDDLKTKCAAGAGTALEKELIVQIQKCIAMMCYSKSLRDPMFVNELIVVTATKTENVKAPDVKAYEALSEEYKTMAESLLNKLVETLNAEASPTVLIPFYESENYVDPDTAEDQTSFDEARPGNKQAKGSFFF